MQESIVFPLGEMTQMPLFDIEGLRLRCSKLILGSTMLANEQLEASYALLDAYVAVGGNMIDTAHVYGASGAIALGQWMIERANRDRMLIIGKGAHLDHRGPRVNRMAIEQDLLISLERMQLDYVDLYMLHRDDETVEVASVMEWLQEQLEAGRCHAIGASNWTTARIEAANDYARQHGLTPFACSSPNLSLAVPNEPRWEGCVSVNEEDAAWYTRTQLPLLSWSSQAGGFFTGRYSADQQDDADAVRVYYSDTNWERYARAKQLAESKGTDANAIALAYVLQQPFPTGALIGPYQVSELLSSYRALQIALTPEEMAWLAVLPA